jgi:hypothetical protein
MVLLLNQPLPIALAERQVCYLLNDMSLEPFGPEDQQVEIAASVDTFLKPFACPAANLRVTDGMAELKRVPIGEQRIDAHSGLGGGPIVIEVHYGNVVSEVGAGQRPQRALARAVLQCSGGQHKVRKMRDALLHAVVDFAIARASRAESLHRDAKRTRSPAGEAPSY